MPITLTKDQQQAFARVQQFVDGPERCLILKGYAGTGKTFLVGHLARWLATQHRAAALLAPTGRAARVLTDKTGFPGSTIHRYIYNLSALKEKDAEHARFKFYFGLKSSTSDDLKRVIIVDESSMVADCVNETEFLRFGSGRLLKDLFEFARMTDPTQESKIIFVGDDAQLPPVGMPLSPALDPKYLLKHHHIHVDTVELTEVVRQAADSPILAAATQVRDNIRAGRFNQLTIAPNPPAIVPTTSDDVAGRWKQQYRPQLPPPFVCITFANDTALRYNIATRARIWGGDGKQDIQPGDFVMIIANNRATGLLNGDLALVKQVHGTKETRNGRIFIDKKETHIPLHFRHVTLAFEIAGQPPAECTCRILENALHTHKLDIMPEEQKALYADFCTRRKDVQPNTEAFTQAIAEDPYFNAVRIKYGYAATCHKAQGGEWDEAVVVFEHQRTDRDAQRWVYTAITRAKKVLYGVNLPHQTPWDGLFKDADGDHMPIQIEPESTYTEPETEQPLPAALELSETAPDFLSQRHARIIHAWQAVGITVTQVIPRIPNYHIQYQIQQDQQTAWLNLYFKKNGSFSLTPTRGADAESPLIKAAEQAFVESNTITFSDNPPVLQEFYEQAMRSKAAEAGLRIVNVEHRPYTERYTFMAADHTLSVADYHYDKRGRFTSVNPISGTPRIA